MNASGITEERHRIAFELEKKNRIPRFSDMLYMSAHNTLGHGQCRIKP